MWGNKKTEFWANLAPIAFLLIGLGCDWITVLFKNSMTADLSINRNLIIGLQILVNLLFAAAGFGMIQISKVKWTIWGYGVGLIAAVFGLIYSFLPLNIPGLMRIVVSYINLAGAFLAVLLAAKAFTRKQND